MAASPNNSHSSSAATPDGLFDEASDNTGCTHISALLADSTESGPLLKRFRGLVSWKAQRTHDALHAAKRRKVPFISSLGASPRLIYAARWRSLRVELAVWLHPVHSCVSTVPSPVAGKTII